MRGVGGERFVWGVASVHSDSGFRHCAGIAEAIERVGLFDTVACHARCARSQ